jgi:hypothetical protein
VRALLSASAARGKEIEDKDVRAGPGGSIWYVKKSGQERAEGESMLGAASGPAPSHTGAVAVATTGGGGPAAAAVVVEAVATTEEYTVDLDAGTCTCLGFKIHKRPCKHLFKALLRARREYGTLPEGVIKASHLVLDTTTLQSTRVRTQP